MGSYDSTKTIFVSESKAYKDVQPKVSVIVPIFNAEDYLEKNIIDYEQQSFSSFELVLVNDGSEDTSLDVIKNLSKRFSNITVVHKVNGGLSDARNAGVTYSKGDYIFFIDPDDTMDKSTIEDLYASIIQTNSDVAVTGYDLVYGKKRKRPGVWIQDLFSVGRQRVRLEEFPDILQAATAWGKLIKRDFYLRNNLEFIEGILYEDQPFTSRMYSLANGIDVIPGYKVHWLQRDTSISHQVTADDLRARLNSARMSLGNLDNEHVYQSRLLQYLNHDFRFSIRNYGRVDTEFDQVILSEIPVFYTELDNKELVDPVANVAYKLIQKKQTEELRKFVNETGISNHRTKYVPNVEGRAIIDWTSFKYIGDYNETNIVLDEEIRIYSRLVQMDNKNGLTLGVQTYFSKIDPNRFSYHVSAALVGVDEETGVETGVEIPLEVSKLAPDTSVIRDTSAWWADYSDTFYSLRLSEHSINMNSTFKIKLIVKAGAYNETVYISSIRQGSSAKWGHVNVSETQQVRLKSGKYEKENFLYLKFVPYALISNVSIEPSGKLLVKFKSQSVIKNAEIYAKASPDTRMLGNLERIDEQNYQFETNIESVIKFQQKSSVNKTSLTGVTNKLQRIVKQKGTFSVWGLRLFNVNGNLILPAVDDAEVNGPVVVRNGINANADFIFGRVVFMSDLSVKKDVVSASLAVVNAPKYPVELVLRIANGKKKLENSVKINDDSTVEINLPLLYDFFNEKRVVPLGKYRITAFVRNPKNLIRQTEHFVIKESLMLEMPHNYYEDGYHRYQLSYSYKSGRPFVQLFNDILDQDKGGNGWGRMLSEYLNSTENVDPKKMLLTTYYGENVTDTALAIWKKMQEIHPDVDVYWAIKDRTIEVPEGAKTVILNSGEYFELQKNAKYFIENNHQPYFSQKRNGQIIVEAFHGYPYKLMGSANYTDNLGVTQARINSFQQREREWDYLISPAPYATPLYAKYFDFHGTFIEEGYPRNDIFFDKQEVEKISQKVKERLNIASDKIVVLYAPTHRENNAIDEFRSKRADFVNYHELAKELGDQYVLLIRAHAMTQRTGDRVATTAQVIDVTDYPDINDLIIVSDLAVLDYSSLRFDYAQTKKPMIFLIPDIEEYEAQRPGLYPYTPTAPGPWVNNLEELRNAIINIETLEKKYTKKYQTFIEEFTPLEDGNSATRVINKIFNN